jgi:hypothetical protein
MLVSVRESRTRVSTPTTYQQWVSALGVNKLAATVRESSTMIGGRASTLSDAGWPRGQRHVHPPFVLGVALAMIAVESLAPGRRWPAAKGWWLRASLLNGFQYALCGEAPILRELGDLPMTIEAPCP